MKMPVGAALASLALTACATAPAPVPGEIADPYEGFSPTRQMVLAPLWTPALLFPCFAFCVHKKCARMR